MPRNNRLCIAGLSLIATVFIAVGSTGVLAAFPLHDWQYFKIITLPVDLQKEGLVEITPDLVEITPDWEVFAGSAAGLVDLRIITGGDTEVPYKLEISKAERKQTSLDAVLRDRAYVPGSHTMFTADLGHQGFLHNQIEVETPSADFGRTATVETSNDGANWVKVAEQTVYDFTVKERRFTTRDTRVKYPDSTARYVRVKIADEGGGPLEIAGANVFFVKETPAREVQWPATILSTSRDIDQGTTLVEVDLGTPKLPSHRIAVDILEVNFNREVILQASADRETWRTILSRSNIYAYNTPKFVGSNLAITYPETASRYLRLIIYDEDSPPLSIQGVDVWGLWRRLVFTANPQHSYRLYYGNMEAKQPSYDIERVFPYLVTEELPEARLDPQATNPDFVEKKPPLSERFPWLFPTVITVAAVLVALLLLGIVRQARKVLPPPPQ